MDHTCGKWIVQYDDIRARVERSCDIHALFLSPAQVDPPLTNLHSASRSVSLYVGHPLPLSYLRLETTADQAIDMPTRWRANIAHRQKLARTTHFPSISNNIK